MICQQFECSIKVKKKKVTDSFEIKATCKFEECQFKYLCVARDITGEYLSFEVKSSGIYDESKHMGKKRRNKTGEFKKEILNDAMEFGSKVAQNKIIMANDLSAVNYKNEAICDTLASINQGKYRLRSFADFDKNDQVDLLCLKQLYKGMPLKLHDPTPNCIRFIRMDNLCVSWGCKSQIEAFLQNKDRVISIDATGNVVTTKETVLDNQFGDDADCSPVVPKPGKKRRPFYYSLVYRSELTNEVIPLYEFISSNHDINTITFLLGILNRKMKKFSAKTCPIKTIVVDFSFALMNSVTMAFNGFNLFVYLEVVHRKFISKDPIVDEFTLVSSCSVHVIKFFADRLKGSSTELKEIHMLSFAKVMLAETYREFLDHFSDLYICMCEDNIPVPIRSRILSISKNDRWRKKICDIQDVQSEPTCWFLREENDNFEIKSSKYMKSPFLEDIKHSIGEKISQNLNANYVPNSLKDKLLENIFSANSVHFVHYGHRLFTQGKPTASLKVTTRWSSAIFCKTLGQSLEE